MFGLMMLLVLAAAGSGQLLAESSEPDKYQAYELKYKDVSEAESVLAEMLDGFGESTQIVVDTKNNRLLVSGPEKAQRVAAKVLKQIDLPPSLEKSTAKDSIVKSYPCSKARLNGIVEKLRDRYSELDGVRIAGYSPGERLLILAPAEIHNEIRTLFNRDEEGIAESSPESPRTLPNTPRETPREISKPRKKPAAVQKAAPQQAERRSKSSAVPDDETESSTEERFIELVHIRTDAIAPFLNKLLGEHCEPIGSKKTAYRISTAKGSSVELTLDRKRNGIRLVGETELNAQVALIIQSIDDPTGTGAEQTRVLPLRGIDPDKIQEIQNAFQLEVRRTAAPRSKPKLGRSKGQKSNIDQATYVGDQDEFSTIQLMGNQDVSGAPGGDANAEPTEKPDYDVQQLQQQLRRIDSDLDVEVVPDLDVIILRGKKADVQEMTRILKELERLSEATEPKIEIYPLKHVRGESLAALIEKVNNDFTGGIRGKVSITPLIKPNALLLIGWGETVTSVLELIEKLDQPVPPDVQFQVFRLKHADATPARTTIQEFFTARTGAGAAPGTGTSMGSGLAPRIQITADIRTNSLIVQAPPRDMQEVTELIQQLDVEGGEVVHQARIFKLKNTLATDMATVLQSAIDASQGKQGTPGTSQKSSLLEFLSVDREGQQILKSAVIDDVKITADPHTNSLLVSASPESMELVAALIRRLDDTASAGAQIKVFRITNGDAASLVIMLRSLLPPPSGGTSPQLANSLDETTLVPTRFSVDQRTNSIIATGSPGDLRIIEALLLRLDQKDVEQRKNKVYRLKNAYSDAVSRSINEFLRTEKIVQQAAPGAISPFQQIESEVVVVPESVSNSLIISASPRYFDEIEALVEKLDAQPPSVMIQVMIASVTLNNTNEFGVELGLQDSLLFDRSLLSNLLTNPSTVQQATAAGIVTNTVNNVLGATNTPGFNFVGQPLGNSGAPSSLATAGQVAGQATSSFGVGTTNSQLGYGGLVLSASSENVSVLLRALQQSNRLEVLSRPQIRTLDNQPAFIQIGQRVPRLQTVSVSTAGSVNGVTLQNIGLILGVTPRISPDGMVVMEVDAENSSIDTVDQGIPVSVSTNGTVIRSPIFNITMAQTTVSANSGETIIIGGLITKNVNDTQRRIPVLSDIPVLGNFFRYDSAVSSRSELLIILTPYVIRSPEEAARIKKEEVARMHWCAGDVVDIYGRGIIGEDPGPFTDSEVPVIYPDANPRGTIQPVEIPPEPALPPVPAALMSGKSDDSRTSKKKSPKIFSAFSKKNE
jgi:type II secretion system protein D